MKILRKTAAAFGALSLTTGSALAHPSLHHTGHESVMHDAWWSAFLIAALLVGFGAYKLYKARR